MSVEMKDSGIAWIGEIPKHWETVKLGDLYSQRKEKVSDKDFPPLSVTMQGILPQLETAAKTDDGDNRKLVRIGDFAINSRSDRRGSCGISSYDGSVSLINTVLVPRNEMNPVFYNWLFHTSLFADEYYKWGHGIVDDLWTTKWQEMKNISVVAPNLEEQSRIANYLDKKCAEIDELITLQEQMIAQLTTYKQAVITETVTKGLDPNVKMKDSGVEWIGEIPEHWEMSRVGIHHNIILGKMLCNTPSDDSYTLESYYCAANVHFDGVDDTELKKMWFSPKEKTLYKVNENDLLVVEGGAGAGGCAIVTNIKEPIYVQNSIMIVRPKTGNVTYLKYLLESLVKKGYIDIVCNKATIPHFTKDKLSNVPYPVISLSEQQNIANYLDKKCKEIDELISVKKDKIEKLKAYKKSVIYEYVTGKKQVN